MANDYSIINYDGPKKLKVNHDSFVEPSFGTNIVSSFTIQLSFIPKRAQYETEFSHVDFPTSVDTENVPIMFLIKSQGDAPHLLMDL